MSVTSSEPFAGTRVIDALGGLLGGYCAKLLGDAGAEVVLLEPPGGDPLRRWRVGDHDSLSADGALFRFLRGGHRAARVDREADVWAWAATGDCLIVGSDGPDPDALVASDPGLVVVSITPYGRRGPWARRPATDFTLQADTGGLTIRGRPDRPPYHAAGRTGDWFSAATAATAAAACLRRAQRTGTGGVVDLSRAECVNLAMTNYSALMAELRGPSGYRRAPAITETPAVEPTADGFVVFTTNTHQQFSDFCVLLGRPDLIERYTGSASRQIAWDEWNEIVHAYTRAHSTAEILEAASALRIPVAPVCSGSTAPAVPHFVDRGVYRRDFTDTFTMPRRPWSITGRPVPDPAPAPGPAGDDEPDGRAPHRCSPVTGPGLPLAGVTVVDNTAWWAGPMATGVLAALGAEVVHIESTTRPDGMRLVGGMFHDQPQWWDRSWFFLAANTNKRSVTLDLTTEAGRDLYRRLAARADVVVENYTPRVFDQFGLTWEALKRENPRLVFARMPAFGLDGPWRDRPGFAQTMESLSGLAWVTGHPDDQPRLQGGPCDPNAGVHAAFAIISALADRDRTGEGCLVEIPMVESALNIAAEQVVEHSAYGTLLERDGNRGPYAAPQGLYPTADGWLAVAVEDDAQWRRLKEVISELDDLASADGASAADRRRNHDRIDEVLAAWVVGRDATDAAEILCAVGVPAAAARDPRRAPEHPQFRARGFFERVDHPVVGEHTTPGLPLRLTEVDRWIRSPAPTLGQHNGPTLSGLGVGPEELTTLTDAAVIGDTIR